LAHLYVIDMTFEELPPKPPQPDPLPAAHTADAGGDVVMQDASLERAEVPVQGEGGAGEGAERDAMEEEEEEEGEERPAHMRWDYKVMRLPRVGAVVARCPCL
jgi:hypothetical protein